MCDTCRAKRIGPYRISTAPRFAAVTLLAQAIVVVAPGCLVRDIDWPHPNTPVMPNDGLLADLVAGRIPDAGVRGKIRANNPPRRCDFR